MTRPSKGARSPVPGPIEEALRLTTRTIDRRARRYRTLVVGVVLVSVLCIVAALALRSWVVLSGLLLLPPLCTTFFWVDNWLVIRWRRRIVALWAEVALDLDTFTHAVAAMRNLPTHTVATMLSSLPTAVTLGGGMTGEPSLRGSLRTVLCAIDSREAYRSAATATSVTLAAGAAAAAIMGRSWMPLFALPAAPLLAAIGRALGTSELRRAMRAAPQMHARGGNALAFQTAVARLDWRGLSKGERDRRLGMPKQIS